MPPVFHDKAKRERLAAKISPRAHLPDLIAAMTCRIYTLLVLSSLSVFAEEHENLAAKKLLPENEGLAAIYPHDLGIDQNKAVIFAENFEQGEIGTNWGEIRNPNGNVLSYAEPEMSSLGSRCLRVEAHLDKDTGGGQTKWFESAPVLFIRFYVKFDKDCDYVHHFVTLRANKSLQGRDKWSGFGQAGLKPNGDERFSTAIEPWGNWGRFRPPGKWNFYSYWPEMKAAPDGKFWGNSFAGDGEEIPLNRWICVEFMLKHNTPGKPDGEQAYWIDGKLMGHWKGINWRTSESLLANALTLESYVTDSWTKKPVNIVFFDNVVIARSYIGPVRN